MNLLFAYFDPSAGSLLLQALVGGFGGLAVFGRYIWMQFLGNGHAEAMIHRSQEVQTLLTRSQEIQIPVSNPR